MARKIFLTAMIPAVVIIVLAVIFVIEPAVFFGHFGGSLQSPTRLTVVTTIFPLADMARNIVGNEAEVVNILPPGASPHTFEPAPADIKKLKGAKILFAIGMSLDAWAAKIAQAQGELEVFGVGRGIALQPLRFVDADEKAGADDPHYWLSPALALIIVDNITDKLVSLDAVRADIYRQNAVAYKEKLEKAKIDIAGLLASLTNRELILFHESFNYFAQEFNLKIISVFEPSPGQEPTPQFLKKLYDTVRAHQAKAVFSEPQLSTETLRPFLRDLGLTTHILDPLGGVAGRNSYIDTLFYNAQTIYDALR